MKLQKTFKKHVPLLVLLLVAALLFTLAFVWARPKQEAQMDPIEYAEYERCIITDILSDSTQIDPVSDNAYRGEQLMLVEVTSGQYKGKQLQVSNYVGPLYGIPLSEGDGAVVIISTYADGTIRGTIYEFDRSIMLAVVVTLFLVAAVLIGGKTGAKSLVGLLITLATLFFILIPALMKGAPTLLTVFCVCAFIAVVTLAILGGLERKTVCAMLGTIAGTAAALLFGLLAQALVRIDGLRTDEVEALLQLRQTGTPIGLKGLLVGGIVISALGAVMDVTMGISSAMQEIYSANRDVPMKELFLSGMNVGRDMVGTMTNTLILALLGSSFTLILYLYSMDLAPHELLSSPYLSIEIISSVSASIGVILSIPLTALICSTVYTKKQ